MASVWDEYQRLNEMQQMRYAQQGMQQATKNYLPTEKLRSAFLGNQKDGLDRDSQLLLLEDVK